MKCVSCSIEIDPKWRHAIEQNVCPFCGQFIVEELLKSLLSSLQDTMHKLQEYPDQLNDWMLANYQFIRTDNPNLKNYVSKDVLKEMKRDYDRDEFDRKKRKEIVKDDEGKEQEVEIEKIQSDSKTAGFLERAGLIKPGAHDNEPGADTDGDMDPIDIDDDDTVEVKPLKSTKPKAFKTQAERNAHFKKIKERIEKTASKKGVNVIESDQPADPEEVAAFQAELAGSDLIHSAISGGNSQDDDDPRLTNRILSMNLAKAQQKDPRVQDGGYNDKDARALQKLVDKANSNNMGGSFSRRD